MLEELRRHKRIWALAAAGKLAGNPPRGANAQLSFGNVAFKFPMAEYFPPPEDGGALDDDTLFWLLFSGEPGKAVNSFLTLNGKPGIGLEFNNETIQQWRREG